jgi:hypothetical protein
MALFQADALSGRKRQVTERWWKMDPVHELLLRLTDGANAEKDSFDPNDNDTIFDIYAGDHVKSKHRFVCKVVVKMKTICSQKWCRVFPLADISCSKDTCEVFIGTIKKTLAKGINNIVDGKVKFSHGVGCWSCTLIDKDDNEYHMESNTTNNVILFMVGDLKFYSQMLGKVEFDGGWCYHC